jgi:hypothetical protein
LQKGKQRKGAKRVKSKKKAKTKQGKKKRKKKTNQKSFLPLFFNFFQKAIFFQKYFADEKMFLFFSIFAISSV